MTWKRFCRVHWWAVCACVSVLVPAIAMGIAYPLQPEDIQNAYSLGKTTNHQQLTDFLKQYQRNFPYPSDQPLAYMKFVEVQTPYEEIVLRAEQTNGYTMFQAAEDYKADPGLMHVRVQVSLRNTYAGPAPDANAFNVVVSQSKPIHARNVTSTVPCNPYDPYSYSTLGNCDAYTREIVLSFEASQFAPGRLRIQVTLPENRSQETTFNLNRLK